jgi:hypothetical protein
MRGSIVETDDLCAITGYERPGDAAKCLRGQGIRVFDSRRGPWTTVELINAAGGLSGAGAANAAPYDPRDVF